MHALVHHLVFSDKFIHYYQLFWQTIMINIINMKRCNVFLSHIHKNIIIINKY